jgi:hypothetical protein
MFTVGLERVKSADPLEVNVVPAVVRAPLTVSGEALLASVIPTTLLPTGALMSVLPVPVPELMIFPLLLTCAPEMVMPLAVAELRLIVRLAVPVMPPDTVRIEVVPLLVHV